MTKLPAVTVACLLLTSLAACNSNGLSSDGGNPPDGGGALPDGGPPDAGLPDAGPDAGLDAGFFGVSRCQGSGLAVCEDFETTVALDGGIWHATTKNGSVTIDSIHAARGSSALHVHVENAAGNHAVLMNSSLFAAGGWPGNHFFGRTFFWLEPSATTNHNGFITAQGPVLAADGGPTGSSAIYGVHETHDNFVTHYGLNGPPDGGFCDCGVKSSRPIPVGHWACLEWEFDGPANSTHTWVDEEEVLDAAITPAMGYRAPQFQNLTVGFTMYHTELDAGAAYDLWYDELALDSARIGCLR